jgi:hypothetical protein
VKLLLACFWFLVGIWILVSQALTEKQDLSIPLFGSRFSPGWLAIFLGLFNLVRWGLERAARSQHRQADAAWAEQARPEESEPNPDFDFKNPPS